MFERSSGVLLHISSLPSEYGIGDMGPAAYQFVDFLKAHDQRYWQILPLNPTSPEHDNSPYHSVSAFAFNPLLISPELLREEGLLNAADVKLFQKFHEKRISFSKVIPLKEKLLNKACANFIQKKQKADFSAFCNNHDSWLEDYALFVALRNHHGQIPWNQWSEPLQKRDPQALKEAAESLASEIEKHKILQFLFFQQWQKLKQYAHDNGIDIIGDVPIYVTFDSADIWTNTDIFKLDDDFNPRFLSGVPPDYFSETGQLWGNPVYDWDVLKSRQYDWWIQRLRHNTTLFDVVRIDHFRGMVAYWEVPAGETTAEKGEWIDVPASDFFTKLKKEIPHLPFIAEDLGTITPDVVDIIHEFELPGMRVLQFGFGDDYPNGRNIFHQATPDTIMYTGTHDNNTIVGWFESESTPGEREHLSRYLGKRLNKSQIAWDMIRLTMMSVSKLIVIPMQDILNLNEKSRMNRPGHYQGNWRWRMTRDQLDNTPIQQLRDLTQIYGRSHL